MSVTTPPIDTRLWIPPIHKTVATEGKGIAELAETIAKHAAHLRQSGEWAARDRARLESELEVVLEEALMTRFHENIPHEKYEEIVEKVLSRSLSPWDAVKSLLNGSSR
jgi:LAO/AO transport system kinase